MSTQSAIRFLGCTLLLFLLVGSSFSAVSLQATPDSEAGLYATIKTSLGDIVVKLYEKETPVTVKNFVDLAQGNKEWRDPKTGEMMNKPLYPGTIFHRVIPQFMIQGGDPAGTGSGVIGYTIPDEIHPDLRFDVPGRVAMANAGPDTNDCQFFITEVPVPSLDGAHTIFGQVVQGDETVSKIAGVPRDADDLPSEPVTIIEVQIRRVE